MSTRAAFLDRDGVINQKAPEGAYVTRWEDVKFLAGIVRAIAQLKDAGFRVIVISNQRCVAKGLISVSELETLHGRMKAWLAERGAILDGIYYCPHEKTEPPCECRKPAPGMLFQAARGHAIDLEHSWMIGDSASDLDAGRRAGCRTVLIRAVPGPEAEADIQAPSLLEAVPQILGAQEVALLK
jgi:D-glycero-D-manno-heptose 1,7-bisphosphate phosphatase